MSTDYKGLIQRLKANPDYGEATYEMGDVPPDVLLEQLKDGGVPYLSMARGPLGVLRAMEFRCGPILRYSRGKTITLAAACLVDRAPIVHYWKVRVS